MRVKIQAEIEVSPRVYEQWGMGRVTLGYMMNESKVINETAEQIKTENQS